MAGTWARRSATATLTANTVDLVYLADSCKTITVVNVTGTAAIYFTVSRPGGSNLIPTITGANCFCLPAAIGSLDTRHDGQFGSTVQLISSGTPTYTVSITE